MSQTFIFANIFAIAHLPPRSLFTSHGCNLLLRKAEGNQRITVLMIRQTER
jgi:hypothetical protein